MYFFPLIVFKRIFFNSLEKKDFTVWEKVRCLSVSDNGGRRRKGGGRMGGEDGMRRMIRGGLIRAG